MKAKTGLLIAGGVAATAAIILASKKAYDMANLIDYDVESFKVQQLRLNGDSRFGLKLAFINKGTLKIQAKDLKMNILSGRKRLTSISKANEFTINPNSKSTTDSTLAINIPQALKYASEAVNKSKNYMNVPLTFKGSIKIKKFGLWIPVPFKFTYTIGEMI